MNLWDETSWDSGPSSQRKAKRPGQPRGPHGVALTQTSQEGKGERSKPQSTEVTLTVQITNKSLTRKHLRMVLDVLLYEIVKRGATLQEMLFLVHLYQLLIGSKDYPVELNDEHERRLCLLSEIIIKALSGKDLETDKGRQVVEDSLSRELIDSGFIMNERTYQSRRGHWDPAKWMKIRAVGLDSFIERSEKTERYSSYCKGYGESHPSTHKRKTRPSAELDGQEPEPQAIRLSELKRLLYLNQLNLKPKRQKEKRV